MSRVYTAEFENVSITAAQDLFYIAPADDKSVEILGWSFTQFSDVGDAAEEIVRVRVIRGHTTVGSGGSAVTARPRVPSDTAAGCTVRSNDTTIASAGTAVNLYSGGFNIRAGEIVLLPEEYRFEVNQAQGSLVLRLMAAPADAITLSGTLWFKERG